MALSSLIFIALVAFAAADVSELSNEYLPPIQDGGFGGGAVSGGFSGGHSGGHSGGVGISGGHGGFVSGGHSGGGGGGFSSGGAVAHHEPSREYLAPIDSAPAHSYSSDEGYRYKTAKRRVFRNRRVYRQRRRY